MAQDTTLRVTGIPETLRALERELGDNGRVYRQTVKAIKEAGGDAVRRARGYLPTDSETGPLPSGFTHKNVRGWAVSRTEKARAFPRYDKRAADSSIRIVSARERSRMTDNGWRAGRMYGISVEMKDAAASIYDVAGNGKSRRQIAKRSSDPRSEQFIGLLRRAWIGHPNWRFHVVLPAVVDTRPEIIAKINAVLAIAERHLERERTSKWTAA